MTARTPGASRTSGTSPTPAAVPTSAAARTVLVTGTGGAGRTTVAAATALAAARNGERTLLLSPEQDGVLEAVLGVPLSTGTPGAGRTSPEPDGTAAGRRQQQPWSAAVTIAPGLWAARLETDAHFRTQLLALQERGGAALDFLGTETLDDTELTVPPGADIVALLRALRVLHDGEPEPAGEQPLPWDVVVIDMPALPHALAALALPEQLRRYLRRLLPPEKQAARALRPLLAQLAGVPMPTGRLYGTAARWETELGAVQTAVESARTTVRLVTDPGPVAAGALRTARAGLGLYGLRLEAIVANRVLPTGSRDTWLAGWSGQQQTVLGELRAAEAAAGSGAAPLYELPHLGRDPLGLDDLTELAAHCGPPGHGPSAMAHAGPAGPTGMTGMAGLTGMAGRVEDRLAAEGAFHWLLPLPGLGREEVGCLRRGDELIVSAGPHRRLLPLPSALRRCRIEGAALTDGELCVRFTPDPGLWPHTPGTRSGNVESRKTLPP